MGVGRFQRSGVWGAALACALAVAGCGAPPGGGTTAGAPAASAGSSGSGGGAAPAGQTLTVTSLKGWQVGVGSGGVGPQIDSKTGNPTPPSLMLPGDKSYVWADLKKAFTTFSFDAKTQGLFDFYFDVNDSGQGYMFRIDTRGGQNYSGFAATSDWQTWDCPANGTNDDPANTWIHVVLTIAGSNVTATATWNGGKETFTFNGSQSGCNVTPLSGTTFTTFKPTGTAFGFQGDGLGADSYTWIANFQYK
jgi:hypothetical protein